MSSTPNLEPIGQALGPYVKLLDLCTVYLEPRLRLYKLARTLCGAQGPDPVPSLEKTRWKIGPKWSEDKHVQGQMPEFAPEVTSDKVCQSKCQNQRTHYMKYVRSDAFFWKLPDGPPEFISRSPSGEARKDARMYVSLQLDCCQGSCQEKGRKICCKDGRVEYMSRKL